MKVIGFLLGEEHGKAEMLRRIRALQEFIRSTEQLGRNYVSLIKQQAALKCVAPKKQYTRSEISLSRKTYFLVSFILLGVLTILICYFASPEIPSNLAVLCFLIWAIPSFWAFVLYKYSHKERGKLRYFVPSGWSTKEERIFCLAVGVLVAIILSFTIISIYVSGGEPPSIFITCNEQKEYAIESIKIHTDFVHGLTQGILLIRQSFFVIVTGLLLYYFMKTENRISKEKLLLLILFATFVCHFYEGIHSSWQSEHLNRIYLLTRGLDSDIIQQSSLPIVFKYRKLPFFEDENKGFWKSAFSVMIFNFSIYLNTNSIVFYYFVFAIVSALVLVLTEPAQDRHMFFT